MAEFHSEHPLLPQRFQGLEKVWLDLSECQNVEIPDQVRNDTPKTNIKNIEIPGQAWNNSNTNKLYLGRYAENRTIYTQDQFQSEEPRTFHLGIDIELPAETELHLPLSGKVHSLANNSSEGNYGPTVIIEHQQNGQTFYSLYGHLSTQTLSDLTPGQLISSGEVFAHVGNITENGGWPAHVHVQLIIDLQGHSGDYPGVCKLSEKEKYLSNCPDPSGFTLF